MRNFKVRSAPSTRTRRVQREGIWDEGKQTPDAGFIAGNDSEVLSCALIGEGVFEGVGNEWGAEMDSLSAPVYTGATEEASCEGAGSTAGNAFVALRPFWVEFT